MSYYRMDYGMTNPGTPGWQFAPVPGWGMNPAAAGPPRVGVGNAAETPMVVQGEVPMPPFAPANGVLGAGHAIPLNAFGQDNERTATDIEGRYKQTSWGLVAAVGAGALLLGLFLGYVAKRSLRANRRRLTTNRRRSRLNPRRRRRARRNPCGRSLTANVRWSTKYKNQLPDSAFFYVGPGGRKKRTKRGTFTVPKSKRKLPYKNLSGRVDRGHLLAAIGRAGQKKTQIPAAEKKRIQARGRRIYERDFGYKTGEARELAKAA